VTAERRSLSRWITVAAFESPFSESISLPSSYQLDTTRFTMAILSTILVGLIVGVIAKLLMPGKDPGGFIITILLGIAGAFIASYLGQALGWYKPGQPAGWIMSIIGAMILLLLYRLLFKRKS
jgi:uncharacterized membrane protein YeaQ/YmgE (transglycosylase-associated protein family)